MAKTMRVKASGPIWVLVDIASNTVQKKKFGTYERAIEWCIIHGHKVLI